MTVSILHLIVQLIEDPQDRSYIVYKLINEIQAYEDAQKIVIQALQTQITELKKHI